MDSKADAGAVTLKVNLRDKLVFSSRGKWLHPLFDLGRFLDHHDLDPRQLTVYDKIVGKAAALLIVRLGIGHVKVGILSSLGETVFIHHNVNYAYEKRVARILCRTEDILQNTHDLDEAYELLLARSLE